MGPNPNVLESYNWYRHTKLLIKVNQHDRIWVQRSLNSINLRRCLAKCRPRHLSSQPRILVQTHHLKHRRQLRWRPLHWFSCKIDQLLMLDQRQSAPTLTIWDPTTATNKRKKYTEVYINHSSNAQNELNPINFWRSLARRRPRRLSSQPRM